MTPPSWTAPAGPLSRWACALVPGGATLAALCGPAGAGWLAAGLTGAALAGRPLRPLLLAGVGALVVALALHAAIRARLPVGERLDVTLVGDIEHVVLRDGRAGRIDVRVRQCRPGCRVRRVRLGLYAPLDVAVGERWRLAARLGAPRAAADPGRAAPELRLWRQRIDAQGYVRDPDTAVRLARAPPPGVLTRLRGALAARIETAAPRGADLLRALLLGDRDGLDASRWQRLARTGTTHLFVVSGLHVGLFAAILTILLRLAGGSVLSLRGAVLALAGVAAYALLTGLGVPARRALLMFALLLWARVAGRVGAAPRALGWAATLILLVDPLTVLDAGFWLSVLAVAALLALVGSARGGPMARLAAALRAQFAVTLVLSFPLLVAFGWIPLLAPLINLLAIPLVGLLVLPAGLFALAGVVIGVPQATPLLGLLGALLDAALALPLADAPSLTLVAPAAPWRLAGLGCALLALAIGPRGLRLLALVTALAALGVPPPGPAPGTFAVVVLDVGQGLSVLVRTHRHALLLDAGDAFGSGPDAGDAGAVLVAPALRALGVDRLDRLLVSHADSDHAGGVPGLRRSLPVVDVRGPARVAPRDGPCVRGPGLADWRWDGVRFRVLYPSARADADRDAVPNRRSCVLLVRAADGTAALLPGDVDRWAERRFAPDIGPVALVVAPHHGSATSSGRVLVRSTRPRWVVFPAGVHNAFGHPHPAVVARWERAGACTAVTGRQGMLSWSSLDPGRLQGWRARHPGWWRQAPLRTLPRRCPRPQVPAGADVPGPRRGPADP